MLRNLIVSSNICGHISLNHFFLNKFLHTMKLPDDQMKHILRPGVLILADLFTKHGFEFRVAGGAVRDMLLGKIPIDLDFATTATPIEMKQMFEKEEIRMLNSGGEKHGTITARLEEENFECTTLRIDKVTDGRHAEVEFIRDWELDAGRRDLTINALFLGLDGTIYDYFNGIDHVQNRIVTFVGDPDKRMKEDYLRILRYFRFFGRISEDPSKHDPLVIESIERNCKGLSKISGERIWVELKKIVIGKFSGEMISKMVECGIGCHIGFPNDFDTNRVMKIYKRMQYSDAEYSDYHPCTLLASGFTNEEDAQRFIERVKCSNKEKDTLLSIIKSRDLVAELKSSKVIKDILVDMVYKDKKSKDGSLFVIRELLKYCGRTDFLKEMTTDFIPAFPLRGGMLVNRVSKRNQINKEIKRLLEIWKDSNYNLSQEELLNLVQNE